MDGVGADGAHGGQVGVVVDGAAARVEGGDGLHLGLGEAEAEDVEGFGHALAAHRLGDDHDAPLVEPAQHDGCHAAAVGPGDGFRGLVMDLATAFVSTLNLGANYGVVGQLSLMCNPVMHLGPADFARCLDGMQRIRTRLDETHHGFRSEAVGHLLMAHILDLYDVHMRTHAAMRLSGRTALLLNRFVALLYEGAWRRHRDVAHYASLLCVTPHYLSELCRKVSGRPATYWIDLFTMQEVCRLLSQRGRTVAGIAADLHFSSPAHFSAYVAKRLGLSPARYRAGLARR